jgi:hypothetical protein
MEWTEEDEERIAHLPLDMRRGACRVIQRLLKKALPGNAAWRRLENEFGYSGDYSAADEGMHWSDNK